MRLTYVITRMLSTPRSYARWGIAILASTALVTTITAGGPPPISAAAATAIREANTQWLPAMKRGDVAAIVAPYSQDALFVTAKGEAVRGHDAIAELYRSRLAAVAAVVGGDIVSDGEVAATPDLVYEWGHGSLILMQKDGGQSKGGGPYLTVWHKDSAGHWLIVRNIVF